MLTRRKIISSVALGLALTLLMAISASAQQANLGGSAYFRDANAASDMLVIDLTDAAELPHGSRYEAWLVDSDGEHMSVGTLGRGPFLQGEYVDPDGTNLLARYAVFLITAEALEDDDPAPSTIRYVAATRGPVLSGITSLIGPAAATRDQAAGILADARAASNADDLDERKTRAQSVIDALDGLVTQAQAASEQANNIVLSGVGNVEIDDTANEIIRAANCVTRLTQNTRAAAMRVVDAPAVDVAVKVQTQNLLLDAERLYNGTRRDGGSVDDDCLVGGALAVYEKTQDLGEFRPRQGGALPATGDSLVSTVALAALLAGLALAVGGGMLVLRGRRMTAAAA